jgi:indole-3-glycerol phosphate synthase
MSILDEIVARKKNEVERVRQSISLEKLVKSPNFKHTPISLKKALSAENSSGIIAEFKRQSPSKGIINDQVDITKVTHGYLSANVAAQSILTDLHFFGGDVLDLIKARDVNKEKPILRKDFIVDAFQIIESKAIGADVILLIASILNEKELLVFSKLAEDLGLEVLYEVHTEQELDKIGLLDGKIIGVNNRDLKTFKVNLEHSIELASKIPATCIKVSESGISDPLIVSGLKEYGFKGFLIGEHFMNSEDPGESCREFIKMIH